MSCSHTALPSKISIFKDLISAFCMWLVRGYQIDFEEVGSPLPKLLVAITRGDLREKSINVHQGNLARRETSEIELKGRRALDVCMLANRHL